MKTKTDNIVIVDAPKLVKDWVGCHVMSWNEMSNHYFEFPRKTIFKISSAGIIKYLKSMPCECCGVSGVVSIRRSKADFLRDFSFIEFE